jgi:hypothetical protein
MKNSFAVLAMCLLSGMIGAGGLLQQNATTVNATGLKGPNYTVNYVTQSAWGSGAVVNVTIKNTGTTAINGWNLTWTFSGNQKITSIWNAGYTQNDTSVTAKNALYNATIAAGRTVSFGFIIIYSGTNTKPTSFTLNNTAFPTATASTMATPRATARTTTTPRATVTPRATANATATVTPSATSGNTFYTSSVNDGLNANDRVLFETYFQNMGYKLSGSNTNIKAAQINTLLNRTDISLYYHTGHGNTGYIYTLDNGLSVSGVTGINIPTVIFATCLTMSKTTWKSKMNSSCNNIFGYTDYSYDQVDDDVVKKFASEAKSGDSMIQAWYTANIASSYLSDRWCGYVRENNSIVEYSARTSNTPKTTTAGTKAMNSKGTLKVATNLLADTSTYDSYFYKIRNSEIKVKGSKTHYAKFYNKTTAFLPKVAMDHDQAVKIAKSWVSSSLPSDAVQESVTQIIVTETSGATKVVGQVVRYARYVDGLAIRTNGAEDHLAVLVNNDGVAAVSKLWPNLETKSKPGAIPYSKMLSLSTAIQKAGPKIAQLIKANKTIVITAANPCYGTTKKGAVVPAYELIDSQGGRIIINAVTAELIF